MSATDDLLANNATYAASFGASQLPAPPRLRVAVVACMDARLDVGRALGLREGDAHVIRNAGGVVGDDEIHSLAISQRKLGTDEVILIQHTRCGVLGFDDVAFADQIESETGHRPDWPPSGFTDLDQSVRDGIERIRTSPFLPRTDQVRGFAFDVDTGALREVS